MASEGQIATDRISLETFRRVLAKYEATRDRVHLEKKTSDRVKKLDGIRYDEIPNAMSIRKEESDAHVTKTELTELMDWKLSHGTFRPSLKGLIAKNDGAAVEEVTRNGYAALPDIKAAVLKMTELKGVGPATAALLLSAHSPDEIPFFSDELFRWAMSKEDEPIDWRRKIKYNVSEYLSLAEKVTSLRQRLGQDITAVECEKVAYVLGHEEDVSTKRKLEDDEEIEVPKKKTVRELKRNPRARTRAR